MLLEVHEAFDFDIYNDVVRIHQSQRNGIEAGSICALRVIRNATRCWPRLVIVRGLERAGSKRSDCSIPDIDQPNWIRLDEVTRRKLGVRTGSTYEFEIAKVPCLMEFIWAFQSSNPTTRIATQISIATFILGALVGHYWT